jgi:hypothetical protein
VTIRGGSTGPRLLRRVLRRLCSIWIRLSFIRKQPFYFAAIATGDDLLCCGRRSGEIRAGRGTLACRLPGLCPRWNHGRHNRRIFCASAHYAGAACAGRGTRGCRLRGLCPRWPHRHNGNICCAGSRYAGGFRYIRSGGTAHASHQLGGPLRKTLCGRLGNRRRSGQNKQAGDERPRFSEPRQTCGDHIQLEVAFHACLNPFGKIHCRAGDESTQRILGHRGWPVKSNSVIRRLPNRGAAKICMASANRH